jgi:hypothetical protein
MKITPDHLARGAFSYVRQSTVDQLVNRRGGEVGRERFLPISFGAGAR